MTTRTRPSSHALRLLGLAGLVLLATLIDSVRTPSPPRLVVMQAQFAAFGLTDLALFTEAHYTRHPSQTDRYAAFRDHPGALEHFPSGALLKPPPHLLSQ